MTPAKRAKRAPPELYWLAKWEAAMVRLKKARTEYKSASTYRRKPDEPCVFPFARLSRARRELRLALAAEPKFMRLFAECAQEHFTRRRWSP